MMRKKKTQTTVQYKVGEAPAYQLTRVTTTESANQTTRCTSFLGIIYDKAIADMLCETLNRQKRK
jgi:hypothetical protein